MGIKGIYKEIGPGNRISLTKLAVQTLEETGRPLRIAIDISIWQFQIQAARGGSNPAVRTLFYRLLRLLSLSIQPIFVFDGAEKPIFKRNKRSAKADGVATGMAKQLISLFGFRAHDAPGEAEAECALLQQRGIVDAVLSEDVDTIMFGCTRTLRNWSSEGTKGSKTPTHVSMYETHELRQGAVGLDREGMVLVALMSGGDYLPEGIPGAGIKLACEAARAGFGKSLCQLKKSDTSGLARWRERLTHELQNNESGFFRTKHKALNIPEDFPNMKILRYYTHPVVSTIESLEKLGRENWDGQIDIQGLREFVRKNFDWSYRIGAIKFIRVLAPCLLVRKLMQHSAEQDDASEAALEFVRSIKNRRTHSSTDATPELRVSFIPTSIVGYNFEEEPDEVVEFGRDGLALNSDDDMGDPANEIGDTESTAKSAARKPFSPTDPELAWIPEIIVRTGIPWMVEEWEEAQRTKAATRSKPRATKRTAKTGGATAGALDTFVRVTKNNVSQAAEGKKVTGPPAKPGATTPVRFRTPLDVIPAASQSNTPPVLSPTQCTSKSLPTRPNKSPRSKPPQYRRNPPGTPKGDVNINPWTIASSRGSLGVTKSMLSPTKAYEPILIPSNPTSPSTKPVSPSMSRDRDGCNQDGLDPFTTQPKIPRKRPSLTSPRPTLDGTDVLGYKIARDKSPTPSSAEKSRCKPARVELPPVDASIPCPIPRQTTKPRQTKKRTAAIEIVSLDSEDEDDLELPPLSSLLGKTTKDNNTLPETTTPSVRTTKGSPEAEPGRLRKNTKMRDEQQQQKKKQQTTLEQSFGGSGAVRMTKLYVPRKSQPGFFKEVDVSVDEADALKEEYAATASARNGGRRRAVGGWRRSDVSYVDLTGED